MPTKACRLLSVAFLIVTLPLAGCGAPASPTPDASATGVAREAARTSTAAAQPSPPPAATATPAPTATASATPTPSPFSRTGLPARPTPEAQGTPLEGPFRPADWAAAQALAAQVEPERLMADVRWLADDARRGRKAGTVDGDLVRDWLVERAEALGLQPFAAIGLVGYTQPFTVRTESSTRDVALADNVVALIPGAVYPERYVYLTAHYDHLGVTAEEQVFNGADDNATGVAAILEAARILTGAAPPEETLVFVAFSSEEILLQGSAALCQALQATGLTGSSQVLNLDVLGALAGTNTFLDVWDEENPSTEPLVQTVQAAAAGLNVPAVRRGRDPGSDALRLLGCGVPAISLTVAWSLETHPCIHQPCDDPDRIDVDGFANAARVAVAAAWLLAHDGR